MESGHLEYSVYALHRGDENYRYIGVSAFPAKRLNQHRATAKSGKKLPVYNWMRKYGPDDIQMKILLTCETPEEAFAWEHIWITTLRGLEYVLMNLTDGGQGHWGYKQSDEQRAETSARFKGKPLTDEHKAKIGASNTGKVRSEKTRKLWSEQRKGRKSTPESRAKQSAALKGRKATEAQKAAIREYWTGKPKDEGQREKIRQTLLSKNIRGEQSGHHKLTDETVRYIVREVENGRLRKDLAKELRLSRATVENVMLGKSWTHVTGFERKPKDV